jgi:hypothetical protein
VLWTACALDLHQQATETQGMVGLHALQLEQQQLLEATTADYCADTMPLSGAIPIELWHSLPKEHYAAKSTQISCGSCSSGGVCLLLLVCPGPTLSVIFLQIVSRS